MLNELFYHDKLKNEWEILLSQRTCCVYLIIFCKLYCYELINI
jgi:hypothetical protein